MGRAFVVDYREEFYIGKTRLELDRIDLEKDFEAGYWVYTVAAR